MSVEPFDSFDDLMERMQENMRAADANVQTWQAAIKSGDRFVRQTAYGFPIYGEVLPDEEPRNVNVQHYRFCRCYSIACMQGELGDVHVSVIERLLADDEFVAAKERGWR